MITKEDFKILFYTDARLDLTCLEIRALFIDKLSVSNNELQCSKIPEELLQHAKEQLIKSLMWKLYGDLYNDLKQFEYTLAKQELINYLVLNQLHEILNKMISAKEIS